MKKLLRSILAAVAAGGMVSGVFADGSRSVKKALSAKAMKNDRYTFELAENVVRERVAFHNRFGITLVGDLYTPKNAAGKMSGIVVGGSYGSVKEQVAGFYANQMASRGFVALVFDPSFTGDSGGEARNVTSLDINTEDFCAAVDFLSTYGGVDPEKIGAIGICGWGGIALNAASIDTRIKATAAITMYDMHRVMANGYNDVNDNAEARKKTKETLSAQRTKDYLAGKPELNGGRAAKLTGNEPQFQKEYWDYYIQRGYHKNSVNNPGQGWAKTWVLGMMNTPILAYIDEIEAPVLLVHGENAHSRYFSEDVFKRLKGDNKELYIVPGAVHTDLYDNLEKIPFEKITGFFKTNLK